MKLSFIILWLSKLVFSKLFRCFPIVAKFYVLVIGLRLLCISWFVIALIRVPVVNKVFFISRPVILILIPEFRVFSEECLELFMLFFRQRLDEAHDIEFFCV